MDQQVLTAKLPDTGFKKLCLNGELMKGVGISLKEPLRTTIQELLDNPSAFQARKSERMKNVQLAAEVRAELERRRANPPSCKKLCPWIKDENTTPAK